LNAKLEKLETELSVARHEIVERDTAIQSHSRKAAEHQQTVDSLKAVINDFSRSVDGYVEDGDEKKDEKISSLKSVIDNMYRSIDGPKN
jgi:chromosome segregation ATPase